jgi:hypothetical protein
MAITSTAVRAVSPVTVQIDGADWTSLRRMGPDYPRCSRRHCNLCCVADLRGGIGTEYRVALPLCRPLSQSDCRSFRDLRSGCDGRELRCGRLSGVCAAHGQEPTAWRCTSGMASTASASGHWVS